MKNNYFEGIIQLHYCLAYHDVYSNDDKVSVSKFIESLLFKGVSNIVNIDSSKASKLANDLESLGLFVKIKEFSEKSILTGCSDITVYLFNPNNLDNIKKINFKSGPKVWFRYDRNFNN